MPHTSRLVQRIHFEDFGGAEFERLVFAYHVRAGWSDVAWYGQTGSDGGRDIVGNEPLDSQPARKCVIQCVNRATLTQAKANRDMKAALAACGGSLAAFKFVVRGKVSAKLRDAVEASAASLGISSLTIWSGVEFEEHLRLYGEDLLRRFCAGEPFPDSREDLRRFAEDFAGLSDKDALDIMAAVFDRPAFRTRFQEESSLPAFKQAIEDTIAALNTGVWRTREGNEIRRIPTIHHLRDARMKSQVSMAVSLVDKLRRTFSTGLRDGRIRPCACGQSDCPVFMITPAMANELDKIRHDALAAFRGANPRFDVSVS
ncbi:restriction endonuclease [Bradyrhizobium sp. UFLA01-814]|uniref:restriction endonuclease n=1 Tax=Bradyrhizobium sp. UFLA01-814 TaxID=3023480 RepID=UPI00398A58B9